jgi:hypothetical protein
MKNNEHQLIKSFVRENNYAMNCSSYEQMFKLYVSEINNKYNINLQDVDIFFASLCAFVEYHGEAL